MSPYVVITICGIATLLGMVVANNIGTKADREYLERVKAGKGGLRFFQSPWSQVGLVGILFSTTNGPAIYLLSLWQKDGSLLHIVLACVFIFLNVLVLLHTLFQMEGASRKMTALALGLAFTLLALKQFQGQP